MKFGICCGPENGAILARAGADYCEATVGGNLKPLDPDDDIADDLQDSLAAHGLRAEAFCVFVVGVRLTGPDRDFAAAQRYVTVALERAKRAGGEVVVFGSAGARNVPDGYDYDAAWGEMREFLQMTAPIADANGIDIAIEPLNKAESNIITSVSEAIRMADEVAHPRIGVLADLFHIAADGETYDATREAAERGLLMHVHVANKPRRFPTADDAAFLGGFFAALKAGGYDRRVSVEAGFDDLESEARVALGVMRRAWQSL